MPLDTIEIYLLAPLQTTLPENEVEEHEETDDLHELRISAQIMGYHAAKTILPALAIIVTVACGIALSIWSVMQLNQLPIQAFPHFGEPAKVEPAKTEITKEITPPVVRNPVHKKAAKIKTQTKTYKKRQASRYSSQYQDPWMDYYYYAPSHPRGGAITHSDGMVTEYSWNKKK